MSEVEVCHLWAPSEPALQESISSLTSTALHDKGGPHWRRLENEVRTVSAQENTSSLAAEYCNTAHFLREAGRMCEDRSGEPQD